MTWHQINEDLWVDFEMQPECRICPARGFKPSPNHGHVFMMCDDGVGTIPFPCESQRGLRSFLEKEAQLTHHEWADAIPILLQLTVAKHLPFFLTPEEQRILNDPHLFKLATTYGVWGAGR